MTMTYQIGDFVESVDVEPTIRPGKWHLAMARGGRERTTAEFLRRYRFDVYYPLTRAMRVVPQRYLSHKQRLAKAVVKRAITRPIFPGYIFVRFDPDDDSWHRFFEHAGVFGMVCAGDLPAEVPDDMVENIRCKEVDGAVPGVVLMRQLFEVGENVRIKTGPLVDFSAVIEQLPPNMAAQLRAGSIEDIDESERVSLAVHLFGGVTKVSLPVGQIEKL